MATKVTAQLRVLQRYERNHPDRLEGGAAEQLRQLLGKVPAAESVESLQGFEGAAAAVYYRMGRSSRRAEKPQPTLLTGFLGLPGRKSQIATRGLSAASTEGVAR